MTSSPVESTSGLHSCAALSRRIRRKTVRLMLFASDIVALVASGYLATYVRFGNLAVPVTFENRDIYVTFVALSIMAVPLWLSFLATEGLYDLDRLSWGMGELGSVSRALSLGVVGFIVFTYVLKLAGLSRAWLLLVWAFSVALVLAGRVIVRAVIMRRRVRGDFAKPTLVVGSNAEGAAIIRVLSANPTSGLVPAGCLSSSQSERLSLDFCSPEIPCLGSARELRDVIGVHRIDTVVIASSAFDHDVLARMLAELRDQDVDVHVSSGLFEILTRRVLVREVGGVPLITVKGLSLSRRNLLTKRVFDIVVALLIVLVGMPIWLTIVAIIKATSPGPVFYGQERIGKGGRPFKMLKFRSMVANADQLLAELRAANEASGPLFKMKDDPRVTKIGHWMRGHSIDEFPQLLNVLMGEMSLVGPRPPLPREVNEYTEHHWRRLEVVPGMTGLWQVSGRSALTFDEMVRLDLFYIENWSVGLDTSLLFRTIPAVVFARGAY